MTKTSSSSRAHLALNVRMDGARKMALKRAKKKLIAAIPVPVSCGNGMSTDSGDELNLWHLPRDRTTTCTTGTSSTLSEHCNCGTSTVFCSFNPRHLSLNNNGCHQPCPGTAPVNPTSLHDHRDAHNREGTATAAPPRMSA